MAVGSAYLFLLGLASGIAVLTTTAYRRASPSWLKWTLLGTGLLVMGRYVSMALFTVPDAPERFWIWRHVWFGTSIGLTLPSVMAIDQLVRHPAMSPAKLLRVCSPLLALDVAVMLFGGMTAQSEPGVGWTVQLNAGWRMLLSMTHAVFVIGFVGIGVSLITKIQVRPIQLALGGLVLAHSYLGLDGLLCALQIRYFKPFLYSELLALVALWYAFETAAKLQQSP